ncbi:MAG TPA: hypothetical protein VF183_03380, partial [Acidimicrobiales bacterium]
MAWVRRSVTGTLPVDPVGEAVAEAAAEVFVGASVELCYEPLSATPTTSEADPAVAVAEDEEPPGWRSWLTVRLNERIAPLVRVDATPIRFMLEALPRAALRTARRFRPATHTDEQPVAAALRRAVRDTLAADLLADVAATRADCAVPVELVADTIDYLIELGGSRVEAQDLTHGVV